MVPVGKPAGLLKWSRRLGSEFLWLSFNLRRGVRYDGGRGFAGPLSIARSSRKRLILLKKAPKKAHSLI